MKYSKSVFLTALILAALTTGAWAQTETASNGPAKGAESAPTLPPVTAADIQELRDALAAQQRQIQALQEQLQIKDQALQQHVQSAASSAVQPANSVPPCPSWQPR